MVVKFPCWLGLFIFSWPTLYALDESLQVCPSSLHVEIADSEDTLTVAVSITNLASQVAYVGVWVNDTFNNPRDAEWRAGNATLPPHDLYAQLIEEDKDIGTPDLESLVETRAAVGEGGLIPTEWKLLTLTLPSRFNITEGSRAAKYVAGQCSIQGDSGDPSWVRRIECPAFAAAVASSGCRLQAFLGTTERTVELRASGTCRRKQVLRLVAEYREAFNASAVMKDVLFKLEGCDNCRVVGRRLTDEPTMSSSPRDAPSFDPGWPTEWPYDHDLPYANPFRWTNATKEWPTVARTSIAKSPSVMVIDTYMRLDHPDLALNYVFNSAEILGDDDFDDDGDGVVDNLYGLDGINMNTGDPSWIGSEDHGTAVAGIIAARPSNDIGIAGFGPNLRVLPCGAGETSLSMAATIRCLQYAALNAKRFNLRVINHSYSGATFREDEYRLFRDLEKMGMIHTIASGNIDTNLTEGTGPVTPLMYLARYGVYSLMGIARLNRDGEPGASGHSKYWTHFYFPGELLVTYIDDGTVGQGTGTSYSAPAAAAMIGQMLTVNPMLEPFDVLWILENSIVPIKELEEKCRFGGYPDIGRAIRASQGLWARVAEDYDKQFALLPGETRTIDITVRVRQDEDDPDDQTERHGHVVIYGQDTSRLSQVYKLGEIPISVKRQGS